MTITGWLIRRRLLAMDDSLAQMQGWCRNCDFPKVSDTITEVRAQINNQLARLKI